jgi:lipopolysaccharide biosynthesis glycosyltransferase
METKGINSNAFLLILDTNLKYQSLSLILNLRETQSFESTIIVLYVYESREDRLEYSNLIQKIEEFSEQSLSKNSLKLQVTYISKSERDLLTGNFTLREKSAITRTTFLRLFLSKWISPDFNKILYLDIDILIYEDLETMINSNFETAICAIKGASDSLAKGEHLPNFDSTYFNAGVLLVNIKSWLNLNVEAQILEVGTEGVYPLMDQDILNIVFKDRWGELETKYNFQQIFGHSDLAYEDFQLPSIVHFVGSKPWNESRMTPYVIQYRLQFNKIRKLFPALRDYEE